MMAGIVSASRAVVAAIVGALAVLTEDGAELLTEDDTTIDTEE